MVHGPHTLTLYSEFVLEPFVFAMADIAVYVIRMLFSVVVPFGVVFLYRTVFI